MLKFELGSLVGCGLMVSMFMTSVFMASVWMVPAASAEDAPANGSATDFDSAYAEWKGLLTKLTEMQIRHRSAKPDEKRKLEIDFANSVTDGRKLEIKLAGLAEKALAESSDPGSSAAEFLFTVAADNVRRDNFEISARTSRLLLDKKFNNPILYDIAGIASFATNDFNSAEKYWQKAKDAKTLGQLSTKLEADLKDYKGFWEREQSLRANEAKADDLPRVKFETTQGTLIIELFENEAPNTVANFVKLVEDKFYDGLKFHRVLEHFMAQGGDPKGTGSGGPGYKIACECYNPSARKHFRGTLSMAHAGKDTGGSQFFLTFLPTPHLNGKHTVFGRVIDGFDVLGKLEKINPDNPVSGETPDKIIKATVIRKRSHPYLPKIVKE